MKNPGFENSEFELRLWAKTRVSGIESLNDIFGGTNGFLEKSEEHMERKDRTKVNERRSLAREWGGRRRESAIYQLSCPRRMESTKAQLALL